MQMSAPTLPMNYAPHVGNDDLVKALELIRHATAPTHEDGAFHENAFELADSVLRRVEARKAYEASL